MAVTPSGAELLVLDDVVITVHHPRTDPHALRARVHLSAGQPCAAYLLAPSSPHVSCAPDGRLVTRWPRVEVLDPDADPNPDAAERVWAAAARLRAGLHRVDVSPSATPELCCPTMVAGHGDWHLGQLGRLRQPGPADPCDGWRLLDVDDLGVGDPAWDLGRPAGFWAAGLLDDDVWSTFLESYRSAGGPALPHGDPWQTLDLPARAAVVVAAVRELTRCDPHRDDAPRDDPPSDDSAEALVRACARMSP